MKSVQDMKPAPVGVLTKVLRIFDLLRSEQAGLALKQIADQTGINKTTAYRFLTHLEREGYVSRDDSGHYMLVVDLHRVLPHSRTYSRLRDLSRPTLRKLLAATGETVNLGVLDEGTILYLDVIESPHEFRMVGKIGMRHALHCTAMGKSIAAFLSDEELQAGFSAIRFQPHTPHTITNMVAFRKELETIRQHGFALDNEENMLGARCVGAPVLDSCHQAVAAISIAGPATRIREDKISTFAEAVKEAAREIALRLGYLSAGNEGVQTSSVLSHSRPTWS
jgi:DNA-binding IclR family transcriptional regulator